MKWEWISIAENGLPYTMHEGVPSVEEFIVLIAQKWPWDSEWEFEVDTATNWGTYIDDFWDTQVDWIEGEETHVIAYIQMPRPFEMEVPSSEFFAELVKKRSEINGYCAG